MTSLLNKAWLLPPRQLIVQPKRFRGKINIQKPKPPHYERARVMKFVEPVYASWKRGKSLDELCKKPDQVGFPKPDNPLERIIAREAYNWLSSSRMVAFFHLNPMTTDDRFKLAVALKKVNMYIKVYGRDTLAIAVENTPYKAILQLFISHNIIVFSPEPNVKQLLKIVRKVPSVVLMAGILDGKFVDKKEFVNYASLGDLTAVRTGLVQVLQNAGGVNLNRQLTHHQSLLVSRLQQISSPDSTEDKAEPTTPTADAAV
ncbi:39S ribosomal protein L10, mitochondrial [Athalia rosae]|uniref:39S ribosomal protein L10, mitochondrial n=1 Tax=Athalia rosae TaxID=37344 RepID=UPI0020336ACE|nr:39S ribosomal protein L10, mitochondrial [Athalia rosae]